MESLSNGLKVIEEKLQVKKIEIEKNLQKRRTEIGRCVICGTFIDDPNNFTCGHPECDRELRRIAETYNDKVVTKLFKILGANSMGHAVERADLQDEDVNKLLIISKTSSIEDVTKKIGEILEFLQVTSILGVVNTLKDIKESVVRISGLI